MSLTTIRFQLDGQEVEAEIDPKATALPVLREQLGCTRLKPGCSPQGVCGSCLALVGGKPRLTCTLPAKTLAGKEVLSPAGLPADEARTIAAAFSAGGLDVAGYEAPALLLSLVGARAEAAGEPLTAELARKALGLHHSRAFGYEAIVEAFLLADRALRGEVTLPPAPAQAEAILLGERPFVAELRRPGMLEGALVLAASGEGRLRGLETEAAAALGEDVVILDAAALGLAGPSAGGTGLGPCVPDLPLLLPVGGHLSTPAPLALVLAGTAGRAAAAAAAVGVLGEEGEAPSGELFVRERREGEERVAGCARRVEVRLAVPAADPLAVEPEAAIAVPMLDGRVRVYTSGQDLFHELAQLCAISGLDPDGLELVHLPAGGGLGARQEPRLAALALLAARRTGRPVRLSLDMEQSTRLRPGRPAAELALSLGADEDGRLRALEAEVRIQAGAATGAAPLLAEALLRHVRLAHALPSVALRVVALRGPGPVAAAWPGLLVPEWSAAFDAALDALGALLGRPAAELRRDNLAEPGLVELLDALAAEGLDPRPGVELPGPPGDSALALVERLAADHLRASTGFSELGQGFERAAIERLAARTGLPADHIELRASTAAEVPSGPGLAERDLRLGLLALEDAAGQLAALGLPVGRPVLAEAGEDEPRPGLAVAAVRLDAQGGLDELIVRFHQGEEPLSPAQQGWLQSAVQLALETAVSAERELERGLPETRWTKLGLLKAKALPRVRLQPVPSPGRPPRFAAIQAAALCAVLAALPERPAQLPARDNPIARRAGVRPSRPGAR